MAKVDLDVNNSVKTRFRDIDLFIPRNYKLLLSTTGYEKLSIDLFLQFLDPGSTFVDVGTHVGLFTILAGSKLKKNGKIYSFEPIKDNVEVLKRNIELNNLSSVEVINSAVSSKAGKDIFKIRKDTGLSGFYEHPLGETVKSVQVNKVTLDDYFKDKKVDFIKVDTEGHELDVLEGAKKTLANNPQAKLLIELNPGSLTQNGRSPEELLQFIIKLGYEVYAIDDDLCVTYRITEKHEQWEDILPSYGYANLLCLPNNSKYCLIVSHHSSLSGAELAILDQAKALREQGVMSHFILPRKGPLENSLKRDGFGYHVVSEYSHWAKPIGEDISDEQLRKNKIQSLMASIEIKEIASKLGVNIILNNTLVNPWGFTAAKSLKLPLVWLIHEFGDPDYGILFTRNISDVKRFIVAASDLVVGCSHAVVRDMSTGSRSMNKKIHAIYNPLDIEEIRRESRKKIEKPFKKDTELKLCVVGVVIEGKDQGIAIECVNDLIKRGINAQLYIIGGFISRDYERLLKKRVEELGLNENVKFLGHISNPYPYIKSADAVLMCSHKEAFGRVTAEAMILGTPVIGASGGATTEMITDKQTGWLFEPGNKKSLMLALDNFLSSKQTTKIIQQAQVKISKLLDKNLNSGKMAKLLNSIEPQATSDRPLLVMIEDYIDALEGVRRTLKERENEILKTGAENKAIISRNNELENELLLMKNSLRWRVSSPIFESGKRIVNKVKSRGPKE